MHIPLYDTLFFAIGGGLLPAMVWLWFWLQEDSLHPEPKTMVITTFIAGILIVPIILFLEEKTDKFLSENIFIDITKYGLLSLFMFSLLEEVGKYFSANSIAFHNKNCDEPVDIMIYMISAAIGFAAIENSLFIIKFIEEDFILQDIMLSNNLRFIGATLLHIVTSGIAGGIIALSFYKGRARKIIYTIIGLTTAIVLHTIFNFFIIRSEGIPFDVFLLLWVFAIVLIVLFEKVKKIKKV